MRGNPFPLRANLIASRAIVASGAIVLCLLVLVVEGNCYAQFLPAELRSLSQTGAQAGSQSDLSVAGDRLDEVRELRFSHPGITAHAKTLTKLAFSDEPVLQFGHFTVSVDTNLPTGRYEVRTVGRHGVSNPRVFLVSPLQNIAPSPVSHDVLTPTKLATGTIVHGASTAANVDFFHLSIAAKESVRIDLLAQQLDSRMLGQLRLYDPDGRELASSRGADTVDPFLVLDDLPAGDYVLAVHDLMYRGGDDYHYQLAIQQSESAIDFSNTTPNVPGKLPQSCLPESSTVLMVPPVNTAVQSPSSEQSIDLPHEGDWWFPANHEEHRFEFAAKQGETYALEIVSQRLGEPTDARMIVQQVETSDSNATKYKDVLTIDDSQEIGDGALTLRTRDPINRFTAPVTAKYRLVIRDLDVGESLQARQAFRLQVRHPRPNFTLVAYPVYPHKDINQSRPLGSKLFRGGTESIRVFAIRRDDWTGPINVSIQSLPAGVTCNSVTIAANQSQSLLTLLASEDAASETFDFQVIGQSSDKSMAVTAVPAAMVVARGGGRNFVLSRITTGLAAHVSADDVSPITIQLGDNSELDVKKGQSLSLPVKITRREGNAQPCVCRPRDLGPGITASEITIAGDKAEGNLDIKVDAKSVVGSYSLWLQVETKVSIRANPQSLARAEAYRDSLVKLRDVPAQMTNLEAIKAAIVEAEKRVEAEKATAKPQDLTVYLPSTTATIRVVD